MFFAYFRVFLLIVFTFIFSADSFHLFSDLFSPLFMTFLVLCLLHYLCFLMVFDQSCLLLSFCVNSLDLFYHYFFRFDNFGDLFVTFFAIFRVFRSKLFPLSFLTILFISFTVSFLMYFFTFFVLCLLRYRVT